MGANYEGVLLLERLARRFVDGGRRLVAELIETGKERLLV